MRLLRTMLAPLLFGLVALLPLHAQGQSGSPYAVVVPVTDTTEAQRDDAFGIALAQVLARVAGGQDLRSKSGYGDALKGAVGMVKQYQYQRSGSGIVLQVNFDSGAVNHLISQLGVPSVGVKPPVLLLVTGSDGSLLGKDSLDALTTASAAQGYGVIYPDTGSSPDLTRVAAADPATLATLTAQYKTGLILLGHLRGSSADWTLISGGRPQNWTGKGASEDAMMGDAAGMMAARIGKQLNVIGSGISQGRIWVNGLKSAMDYASLLNVLRSDPTVQQVNTAGALDDGIYLDIKASLPLPALAASLAAGGRMLQGDAHAGADISLHWLH
jgi:hypothetical protein